MVNIATICNQMNISHSNSSQASALFLVLTGINILLSITSTLGNALILAALFKVSSLNPPSKLLLRCLAFSDLAVGLLVQPTAAGSFLPVFLKQWDHCYFIEQLWLLSTSFMCDISVLTTIAINVDRPLALSLGIRYRQVVTIKRARSLVVLVMLVSTGTCVLLMTYTFDSRIFNATMWSLWLVVSTYCYTRIYLTLKNHIQAQIIPQGQPIGISALHLVRYKNTVSSGLWLFAAMMICYLPYASIFILNTVESSFSSPSFSTLTRNLFTTTLLYLNSTVNPMLYYWKINLSNLGL